VRADGDAGHADVSPSVERARLRLQLQALGDIGEIVELGRVLDPPLGQLRPRFAITFDDDYRHHVAHALPVLRDLGVPATFFLSGRVLHGLGHYWWELLEALVAADGIDAARRALGLAAGSSLGDLAVQCESDRGARERLAQIAPTPSEGTLDEHGIHALTQAGMTLGFHTVEHPLLPCLDADQLLQALTFGRAELAAAAGIPVTFLAYPHGKADARVAMAARSAGYSAAWTGRPRPIRRGEDRFLLGRWEPGPLDPDAFAVAVAGRLNLGG
jgi:peptidoglycan/xylan/chitin deacetylase (PgdA/CDA1 family)